MFVKIYNTPLRRLTNGNCCGRCSRPRVPENSSRAIRPLCCFLEPHFVGCWNCFTIPLSQPPKRQLPVTLYAIFPILGLTQFNIVLYLIGKIITLNNLTQPVIDKVNTLFIDIFPSKIPEMLKNGILIQSKKIVLFNLLGFNSPPFRAVMIIQSMISLVDE